MAAEDRSPWREALAAGASEAEAASEQLVVEAQPDRPAAVVAPEQQAAEAAHEQLAAETRQQAWQAAAPVAARRGAARSLQRHNSGGSKRGSREPLPTIEEDKQLPDACAERCGALARLLCRLPTPARGQAARPGAAREAPGAAAGTAAGEPAPSLRERLQARGRDALERSQERPAGPLVVLASVQALAKAAACEAHLEASSAPSTPSTCASDGEEGPSTPTGPSPFGVAA